MTTTSTSADTQKRYILGLDPRPGGALAIYEVASGRVSFIEDADS